MKFHKLLSFAGTFSILRFGFRGSGGSSFFCPNIAFVILILCLFGPLLDGTPYSTFYIWGILIQFTHLLCDFEIFNFFSGSGFPLDFLLV